MTQVGAGTGSRVLAPTRRLLALAPRTRGTPSALQVPGGTLTGTTGGPLTPRGAAGGTEGSALQRWGLPARRRPDTCVEAADTQQCRVWP